jgi:hypothetical protein
MGAACRHVHGSRFAWPEICKVINAELKFGEGKLETFAHWRAISHWLVGLEVARGRWVGPRSASAARQHVERAYSEGGELC